MNEIIPQQFGVVSRLFGQAPVENDLAAGVQAGYGLIGYKGKVWSIRYRGEERPLMRDDGDGARGSIEIVILKASNHLSKIFYEAGYTEGSTASPDCYSSNGVTPDVGSLKKQATACALCPKNQWGSRITPAGKQGKACQDSKRLAIVPLGDLRNEVFGGPMLLRVPAASLQELAQFGQKMQGLGYPYFAIAVRVAFDPSEAYPKFVFNAIRPLTDAEAQVVLELQKDPAVIRILAEGGEAAIAQQAPAQAVVQQAFEQPVAVTPQVTAQAPVQPVQSTPVGITQPPATTPPATQPMATGFGAAAPAQQAGQPAAAPVEAAPAQMELEQAIATAKAAEAQIPATTGFGATAPAEAPAAADTQPAPAATAGDPSETAASFEASLDAALADLMPAQ